jgi:hypothetical protein
LARGLKFQPGSGNASNVGYSPLSPSVGPCARDESRALYADSAMRGNTNGNPGNPNLITANEYREDTTMSARTIK